MNGAADIDAAIKNLDVDAVAQIYHEQNEFLILEHFLGQEAVGPLTAEADQMRSYINRNYIPKHKKGGSVSYYTLVKKAPAILSLYQAPAYSKRMAGAFLTSV